MLTPISNLFGYLLNFLYELVNSNFGVAIILFSIIFRIILLPITIKQQRSVEKTKKIQGQLTALQIKYKNNQEMLNKETFELYKREKISPFSGCLSGIVQIFIILAVFYLVSQPLTYMKKANNSNPELKAVVDEYKENIQKNNNKTRYVEIAVIANMRNDYNSIDEKIYQLQNANEEQSADVENTDNGNSIESKENIETVENIQTDVNTENDKDKDEEKIKNTENNSEKNNKEELESLIKRKANLEKLNINMDFLGLDLSKVPNENFNDFRVYIIPVLYVISSFISIKLNTSMQNKKNQGNKGNSENDVDSMAQMSKSMTYMMPIMAVSIALIAPLGLALYWFVSNVLMIGERFIIKKILDNKEAE